MRKKIDWNDYQFLGILSSLPLNNLSVLISDILNLKLRFYKDTFFADEEFYYILFPTPVSLIKRLYNLNYIFQVYKHKYNPELLKKIKNIDKVDYASPIKIDALGKKYLKFIL